MKVTLVAPTPFGRAGIYGGGERYPLELGRALARHTECELVSFGGRSAQWRESSGLMRRQVRSVGTLRGHPAHPIAPRLLSELRGSDVVHVHHLYALPSQVAALLGRCRGNRVVVTDHGLTGRWADLVAKLYQCHLAVSDYSAKRVRIPPERSPVVYGGAVDAMFDAGAARAAGGDSTRAGLLFVGRLTPHKGVDRLIRALPDGVRLTVVGSGGHDDNEPERSYPQLLRGMAAGKDVHFAGPVGTPQLATLLAASEALVLPSVERTCFGRRIEVSELLGLVALEAMAAGTPVIASRLGGVPEVVLHGETGLLVTPGDVTGLRSRIAQLHGDRRLARRLGRTASEWVASRFTWDHVALRCLAAYEQAGSVE
ncbi:MAG: glycosyltransferase family 4 protein [Actinomycetota bacterium]|nr:glycosyltransferase family 4 protein [Actinomycetota bacterium]